MRITFDPVKREATLRDRKIDFLDAAVVFDGPCTTLEDTRFEYPERRWSSYGYLAGRLVNVVWTGDDHERRIISMRKANERERRRYSH